MRQGGKECAQVLALALTTRRLVGVMTRLQGSEKFTSVNSLEGSNGLPVATCRNETQSKVVRTEGGTGKKREILGAAPADKHVCASPSPLRIYTSVEALGGDRVFPFVSKPLENVARDLDAMKH